MAKPSDGSSGTATATVTIYLNDTNDNSPEFESSVLSANVSEDANVGDFVVQVKVSLSTVLFRGAKHSRVTRHKLESGARMV